MPILPRSYSTPFWLRNPHISTIWPVLFRRMNFPRGENLPPCKRVRLDTEDGDFLDMDVYPTFPMRTEPREQRYFPMGWKETADASIFLDWPGFCCVRDSMCLHGICAVVPVSPTVPNACTTWASQKISLQ